MSTHPDAPSRSSTSQAARSVRAARAARLARQAPATTDFDDASDTQTRPRPQSWRERHALKLLGAVMITMFSLVIVAQVGC